MGQFLTTLKTEQITEATPTRKALFKITSPLIYDSNTLKQTIIVPEGFITDFASVPRIPFLYALLGNLGNSAACLHDFLYTPPHEPQRAGCVPVDRKTADKVLQGAIVDGMVKDGSKETTVLQSLKNLGYIFLGFLFYLGVRVGGASHWGIVKK